MGYGPKPPAASITNCPDATLAWDIPFSLTLGANLGRFCVYNRSIKRPMVVDLVLKKPFALFAGVRLADCP